MPTQPIRLHQALFGYRSGHNLLTSSCQLAPESRRLLAMLTDASGPWPPAGFNHCYTGTPLPDVPYYALFCTWPAPEMPRPGCVWSHVLLIELPDLAAFTDLSELLEVFKRPASTEDQRFSEPIQLRTPQGKVASISDESKLDGLQFLRGLYGQPSKPFVAEAATADAYEKLVFVLWTQQWPKLRRNFRFSTGSFSDRGRGGVPFDLQIMPSITYQSWNREGGRKLFQHPMVSGERSPADWEKEAVQDLVCPGEGALRSFLNTFGADIGDTRGAFVGLSTVYHRILAETPQSWGKVLSQIATFFPSSEDALRLKKWAISTEIQPESANVERTWEVMNFLLISDQAQAFQKLPFDEAQIGESFWKGKKEQILPMLARLIRRSESPFSARFLLAISRAINPADLRSICDAYPELILTFVRSRPSLAFQVDTWHLPEHIQRRIFETLVDLPLDSSNWGHIMSAMFIAATPVGVSEAVRNARENAIEAAFRWFDTEMSKQLLPSQIWREALDEAAAQRLALDDTLSPVQLALCSWLASPHRCREILTAKRRDVKQLAFSGLSVLPKPLALPSAFLLVTLGLRENGADAISLITCGFFEVHEALASNNYSLESWRLLSPELPRGPRWREWDRCQKLRRAVRAHIVTLPGRQKLIDTARNPKEIAIAHDTFNDDLFEESDFID